MLPFGRGSFTGYLIMFGVVLELGISANLLTWLGIPYVSDGGSLLVKLHPGTYMLTATFFLLIIQRNGWSGLMADRQLVAFLGGMAASLIYLLVMTGTGNTIVLLDTFLPAGMLAALLSREGSQRLDELRHMMQIMLVLGALLALAEKATQWTLIPLYLNDDVYHAHEEDFRPTALYDHPLTGSIMTMLGLALRPSPSLLRLPYIMLMWAALVAYGGRMALATSLLVAVVAWGIDASQHLLRRNPKATRMLFAALAALIVAVPCAGLALELGLGTRIAGHLYWDDSAQVRLAQWQLLDQLSGWQLLFGTRRDDLLALLVPLRLGAGVEVIENFWLLMFVSLGAVGFPLFVASFLSLLAWGWRRSALRGRLLLLGVTVVASTSNSLGRKSTILVCLVASVAVLPTRRPRQILRRERAVLLPREVAA